MYGLCGYLLKQFLIKSSSRSSIPYFRINKFEYGLKMLSSHIHDHINTILKMQMCHLKSLTINP